MKLKVYTIGVYSSKTYFQDMYYDFKDFGGHLEYEMIRSLSLQGHLLSAFKSLTPLPLFILVVLKSTDFIEEMKKQIDRWVDFLSKHLHENIKPVHAILVCTHSDIKQIDVNTEGGIFQYFQRKLSSQFIKNDLEITLNGTIRDLEPLNKLRHYFEGTFFYLKSIGLSHTAKLMLHYLNTNYPNFAMKFSKFKERVREDQEFTLEQGVIRFTHYKNEYQHQIIPQDDRSLSNCLDELHNFGEISLLLNSHNKEDCWIVSNEMETFLHSQVMSFLVPVEIQSGTHSLCISNNIGLIPDTDLFKFISEQDLKVDANVIIPYLLSAGFCIKVSKTQLGDISLQDNLKDSEILFIPSLIKKNKDQDAYIEPSGPHSVVWSLESESNFDLIFITVCFLI